MDREIKFRAWDVESERFVSPPEDGEYIWQIHPDKIEILAETQTDKIVGGEHEQKDYWMPINAIIMQYTGLKDRNGKEIFEGDANPDGIVVVYREDKASFALRKKGWAYDHYFGEAMSASDFEVVTNIHSNPELL